ncbi:MAG: hypothetical protein NT069_23235 [Planctomycetota bacterium]|nr:hypothetical protein [Planctomycetota bacterium]
MTNGKRELWRALNFDAIAELAGEAEPQWLVERIPEPQSVKSDDREELRNLKSTVDQLRREQWQSKITLREQVLEILASVDEKAAEQQYQSLRRDLLLLKRVNPTDLWILAKVTEIAILHAGILESLGRPNEALVAFQDARDAGKEEFDANGPLTKDPHEFWFAAKALAEFHQRKQRKPKAVEACRQWLASTYGFFAEHDPDELTDSNLIDRAEAQWLVLKNLPLKNSERKNLAAAVNSTITSLQERKAELSSLLQDAKRELAPQKPKQKTRSPSGGTKKK